MSLMTTTVNSKVLVQFTGYPISGVMIDKHEMPLEHFCAMAGHFLGGGFFGWNRETPEPVKPNFGFLV